MIRPVAPSGLLLGIAASFLGVLMPGSPAGAQGPDSLQVPASGVEAPRVEGVSPRGAFFRSLLIPGWGHAKVGAHVRGGFYFATQSATAFMLVKTQSRISRARDRLELMETVVRERLEGQGIQDPLELEQGVAADEGVQELTALVGTREEQREDWIALGVFLLFLGGADAYVSAHLADFPAAVEIEPRQAGGISLGFSLPVGR